MVWNDWCWWGMYLVGVCLEAVVRVRTVDLQSHTLCLRSQRVVMLPLNFQPLLLSPGCSHSVQHPPLSVGCRAHRLDTESSSPYVRGSWDCISSAIARGACGQCSTMSKSDPRKDWRVHAVCRISSWVAQHSARQCAGWLCTLRASSAWLVRVAC